MPLVLFKVDIPTARTLRAGLKPSSGSDLRSTFTQLGLTLNISNKFVGVKKHRHPDYGDLSVSVADSATERQVAEMLLRRTNVTEVTLEQSPANANLVVPYGTPDGRLRFM